MARRSDEIAVAWNSLSGTIESSGWRSIPISPAGKCKLSAGRRFPENAEALLAGFSATTIGVAVKLPVGQGFAVERVDPQGSGDTWLALTRTASGSIELFLAMTCDVAGALDAETGAEEPHMLETFLRRIHAWQEFMRTGTQPLSPEAEIGLVGELTVLVAIVNEGVFAISALESWVGPKRGLRDFEIGTGGIEVKATTATSNFVASIGSLDQLDDTVRQPLFIAGVRLKQAASGTSLPDVVSLVRDVVRGDSVTERLLAEKLVAAGYFDVQADQYSRRFHVATIRIIEIDSHFPRLIRTNIPAGIIRATYEADLDKVSGVDIGIGAALKKLGAI